MEIKYKFIGDAYLLGIKLNTDIIEYENEKENISINKAFQNVLFAIKKSFKTYTNYLDLVEVRSFVILDGDFYFDNKKYDAFELQIPTTIEKMAETLDGKKYKFYKIPTMIEQLYFMKAINKNSFNIEEFKNAFMKDHKLGLYYNDYMVNYNLYHVNKTSGTLCNEKYPDRWFYYDMNHKYYKMFNNILQVKKIVSN